MYFLCFFKIAKVSIPLHLNLFVDLLRIILNSNHLTDLCLNKTDELSFVLIYRASYTGGRLLLLIVCAKLYKPKARY